MTLLEGGKSMETDRINSRNDLDVLTRILHLGLVVFGLLALITGNFADDYKKVGGLGFITHEWVGIGVTFFVSLRLGYGFWGPVPARFSSWLPCNKERLKLVMEDIAGLLKFRLPDRQPHQGLAGLVEISGLLLFFLLAMSGVFLFFAIEPGYRAQGMTHFVKEIHELGEILLPLFFVVHGGAVALHAMTGAHLWRKMVFLRNR